MIVDDKSCKVWMGNKYNSESGGQNILDGAVMTLG